MMLRNCRLVSWRADPSLASSSGGLETGLRRGMGWRSRQTTALPMARPGAAGMPRKSSAMGLYDHLQDPALGHRVHSFFNSFQGYPHSDQAQGVDLAPGKQLESLLVVLRL